MRARILKIGGGAVLVAALAGGGAAWATAGGEGGSATGPAADRASAAALAHVGGGKVIEVERESESGGVWEVEIRRADGSTVEVALDAGYGVLGAGAESDGSDGAEGGDGTEDEGSDDGETGK